MTKHPIAFTTRKVMRLKNTNTFPPGGFTYTQPETGFKTSKMAPFETCVAEVLAHRVANKLPRSTRAEVNEDIQEFTCQRLGYDAAYCITDKKKLETLSRISASPSHLKNLVRPALEKIKSLGNGAQILSDWLGDGMLPVPNSVAQSRTNACVRGDSGKPCKFNRKGSSFTESIAGAIKEQMQKRHEATAAPVGDEKLFECQICFCDLKLKVHVPMDTILDRTPKAMIEKFQEQAPACCWMRQTKTPA